MSDDQSGRTEPEGFNVRLDQYSGPLDLLLDLVQKQRLDIMDIPIAQVTAQFLESIRAAEEMNIEVSAEFVMMAAILVQIKSKMLLPRPPSIEEEEDEDPREDLVRQLVERQRFLDAAQVLKDRRIAEEFVWTAGAKESILDPDEPASDPEVTLFDLVTTFADVLERVRNEPVVDVSREPVSIAAMIELLKHLIVTEDGPISVRRVLSRQATPRAVVAVFLALLEMVKARAVEIQQEAMFGDIVIRKHASFDDAFRHGRLSSASDAELEYLG